MVVFSKMNILPDNLGQYWKWLGVALTIGVTIDILIIVVDFLKKKASRCEDDTSVSPIRREHDAKLYHSAAMSSGATPQNLNLNPIQIPDKIFYEVLMFPDEGIGCVRYFDSTVGCDKVDCEFSHSETSMIRLLQYLNTTRRTLDLAIFIFTCPELARTVTTLKNKGVIVRVITDTEMMITEGSQIGNLRKSGIAVRQKTSPYIMHHKFAVIDGHTLVTGSFNWTVQAITGNNENIIITNQPRILDPFINEFHKLWLQFKPRSALLGNNK